MDEDGQEDEGGQGCEWGDSGKHPRHQSVINRFGGTGVDRSYVLLKNVFLSRVSS